MLAAWIPIESNPEVLNTLLLNWGISGPYELIDIYTLDEESIQFIPQTLAILFLYPVSVLEKSTINNKGSKFEGEVFYTKQTIQNACGSIALIHAISNNTSNFTINNPFKDYLNKCLNKSPEERAKVLESHEGMRKGHEECSITGQSAVPDTEDVDLHYVCFVNKDERILELDGRKDGVVDHGECGSFVKDVFNVLREWVSETEVLEFNVMALVSKE